MANFDSIVSRALDRNVPTHIQYFFDANIDDYYPFSVPEWFDLGETILKILRESLYYLDKIKFYKPFNIREHFKKVEKLAPFAENKIKIYTLAARVLLGISCKPSDLYPERLLFNEEWLRQQFLHVSSPENLADALSDLALLPVETRTTENVFLWSQISKGYLDSNDRQNVLRELSNLPSMDRKEFFQKVREMIDPDITRENIDAMIYLFTKVTEEHRNHIFSCAKASIFERAVRIKLYTDLIRNTEDDRQRVAILNAINRMSPDRWRLVLSETAPLIQDIHDGYLREEILVVVHRLPQQHINKENIQAIIKLFKPIPKRVFLLKALELVSPYKYIDAINILNQHPEFLGGALVPNLFHIEKIRKGTFEYVLEFFKDIVIAKNATIPVALIKMASNLAIYEKDKYTAEFLRLIGGDIDPDSKKVLLVALKCKSLTAENIREVACAIPEAERSETFQLFSSLIEGISEPTIPCIVCILKIAQNMPKDTLQLVVPLLKDCKDGQLIYNILNFISEFRTAEYRKKEIFEDIIKLFKLITTNAKRNNIAEIIASQSYEKIPEALRVLSEYLELLEGTQGIDSKLISAILDIPQDKRASFITLTAPILKDECINVKTMLTELLSLMPVELINKDLVETFMQLNRSFVKEHCFLYTLNKIPPAKRSEVIEILKQHPELIQGDSTLQNILAFSDELKNASHQYLLTLLNDSMGNQQEALGLSRTIINRAPHLLLHVEHPLFQRAIEVYAIADPSVLSNKKNPYTLLKNLNAQLQKEPLYDVEAEINLDTLRKRGKCKGFTVRDLPEGVSGESLLQLFNRLETRLSGLPNDKRQVAESYIQDSFLRTVPMLKSNLFNKSLIPSLLVVASSPDQPIEGTQFYFFAILKAILDTSSVLSESMMLSPQEEMLLGVSCSINECVTGQKDGIDIYYNQLPPQYRTREMLTQAEEKIGPLIDQSVQTVLNEVFASEDLLKAILGGTKFEQHSHQTLYLKNRLHAQVGLVHRLAFDPHSNVLYDALIEADTKKLIECFFKLCTKEKIVTQLKRDIAQVISDKKIYQSLEKFFEPHVMKGAAPWQLSYFEFSEDYAPLGITDEGAHKLLQIINYF